MDRSLHQALWLAVVVGAGAIACNPHYAPPVRSAHYGAPGRMREAGWETAGGATHYGTGGPFVGVKVADGLTVEMGGELGFIEQSGRWSLGVTGLRYSIDALRDPDGSGASFDVEAGAGLGVGGSRADDIAGEWSERLAGGGYLGAGAAWYADRWFAAFGRARVQLSAARAVPLTFWWSAVLGPEFTFGPVSAYVALGFSGYLNDSDENRGGLIDAGASLHF